MKNIKIIIVILIVSLFVTHFSYSEDVSQKVTENKDVNRELWDAIHYDETGNNLIVELDVVKASLGKGANPNWGHEKYGGRISILHHYVQAIVVHDAEYADGLAAVKLLFEYGAKLNKNDGDILYGPIAWGRYDLVKLLLDNGADPKKFPSSANIGSDITPLELATENNLTDIGKLLISYGAEPLVEQELVIVKFIGAAKESNIALMEDIIKEHGENIVDSYDRMRGTALIKALDTYLYGENVWETVKYLLDNGANPNKEAYVDDFSYYTKPLHIAIYRTSLLLSKKPEDIKVDSLKDSPKTCKTILQELLDKGAYVSGVDGNGRTPLHIAAENNNLVGAKMLIDAGAKIMSKDNDGKTPLDYAESAEMIRLLKDNGAEEA